MNQTYPNLCTTANTERPGTGTAVNVQIKRKIINFTHSGSRKTHSEVDPKPTEELLKITAVTTQEIKTTTESK